MEPITDVHQPAPGSSVNDNGGEAKPVRWTKDGVRRGMMAALPIGVGVLTYGVVFGVLVRQTGLTFLEITLMNVAVLAGASQTAALGLWDYPLPILAMTTTTLLINLRHLLLGASIRPWLQGFPARRVYPLLHFLNDEGWALAMQRYARGERDAGFLAGSLLLVAGCWPLSVAVGYLLGGRLGDPARLGLDFAFTTVFAAMLFGSWRGRFDLVPWGFAGLAAWAASAWLPGTWYVVIGGLAGCLMGALRTDQGREVTAHHQEVDA